MKKNTRKGRTQTPKPPAKVNQASSKVAPPRNLTPELCDRLHRDLTKACLSVVAFVIDVFARKIVGWRVSTSMTTGFVLPSRQIAAQSPAG